MNRWLLFFLHIASLVLLGFGWLLDMLTIRISADILIIGRLELMEETRSVLGTLKNLWETHHIFPFILIGFFGIVIPLVKTYFIFRILLVPQKTAPLVRRFVNGISKWAMADVFAIGVFISFLAANSMDYTTAIIRPGFYYFAAYVLLSNCIVAFLPKADLEELGSVSISHKDAKDTK